MPTARLLTRSRPLAVAAVAVLMPGMAAAGAALVEAGGALPGPGPESVPYAPGMLTLEQAIETALQHNPRLVAAGHARAGAGEGVAQARARFVPRVDVGEIASRTDNPTMVFSNLLGQARFGPANFAIPSLNEPDPLTNFTTRLTVSQPIYAGGQLRAGLAAAERVSEASRGEERRARQETIFGTTRAFLGVLLARQQLRVAKAAHDAAESHLRVAENLLAAGLAVPSDAMRVKVRLAEIEEMVVRARAGEEVARASLEAAIGVQAGGVYEPAEPEGTPAPVPDLEAASARAIRGRPDLAAARAESAAAAQGVRAARGGRRPQAGFVGMYEVNDDALLGSSGTNWTAMVAVNVNVFDGLGSASRVRQSRAEEARASSLVAAFESQVGLEVRQALADLTAAAARLEAARGAVRQAEEALRIVRDRYENGLATITDLLDQETALTSARARAAQADYDRRTGEAALRLAMGTLGEPDGPPAAAGPQEVVP